MNLIKLDRKLREVCPISGVNSAGIIFFSPEATPEQRTAAQLIVTNWNFNSPDVPTSVTMRQARTALSNAGLLAQVELAAQAAGSDVQISWNTSNTVERYNSATLTLVTALGLTEEQVDSLFITASTL